MSEQTSTMNIDISPVYSDCPSLIPLLEIHPNVSIHTRSSKEFASDLETFNTCNSTSPLAFIIPQDESEIASALKLCSTTRIPVSVRGRGHDMFGRGIIQDGVVIDMRNFDNVTISADRESATVGGGVISARLLEILDADGLITPIGLCSAVGYTGWATGGGYGSLSSKFGVGADQILGARVALSSGEIVDTRDGDHDDLLWALRGAGSGKLGAITELRIKVYPRTDFLGGIILFPASEAEKVFDGLASLCEVDCPHEWSGDLLLAKEPNSPSVLTFIFTWMADKTEVDLEKGRAFLEKFKALGSVIMDTVAETTYCQLMDTIGKRTNLVLAYYTQPRIVSSLEGTLGSIFKQYPVPTDVSCVVVHNLHGKVAAENTDACYPTRQNHVAMNLCGAAAPGSSLHSVDMKLGCLWVNTLAEAIDGKGLSWGKSYVAWTRTEDIDMAGFYGQERARRLTDVKVKYDPSNLFVGGLPNL